MTWQALPPEYRDQFYGLRQYVRGEVNWPDARFYRVYIPGLARIALGVWRRLPSAPIDIPPLVTMAATANNLLLWMSPDLQTGTLLRPFFPPILRAMSGDAPAILEVHAPNDEHLPARMVRFNYGFRAAYLVQVGKPAPVRIEYLDEQGDGSIASILTTPLAAETEMTGCVRYEIRGGDLIGVMIVDRLLDDPKITVNYRPDVPDRSGISIEPTLRLAAVLASGDPFRIIDVESGRDLIPVLSGQFVPLDLAVLADALRTAERLAVLRNRLGVELPFPDSIDDDERLILGVLAEGLRHGRVRQSTPGARRTVDLIGVVAIRLAEELQAGPGDFSAEHLTEWIFKGHVVDPGPVRLVFENIRIDEPLEQLRARAASVGPTDTVSVELCFDSVRHEFMDFLEVSYGDNSKSA
ncbi:hypothetical protein WME97_08465 [Sorangium sp. So ce367]|uniref:hypothetical protein n=1 Tax=Sorangium sp. So ce367 TaxID=3133305 RepID=UPI003F61569C